MAKSIFEAVWFDLDGTLFNTAADLIAAVNATARELGYPEMDTAHLRHIINFGSRNMVAQATQSGDEPERLDAAMEIFAKHYGNNLSVHSDWFDGMEAIVEQLESEGTPWGIITNKFQRYAIPLVAELKLDRRIAGLVCGDTLDEGKPSPKPLLHACAQAGHDPTHCLYVGDNSTDIIAGHAAGMTTVAAAYGYTPAGESAAEWGADYTIAQPADLRPIIWPNS